MSATAETTGAFLPGGVAGEPEDLVAAARAFVLAEAAAVGALADHLDGLPAVIDLVAATTGKVVTTGAGTSGSVARRFAHLLSVCGTPSLFLHPGDAIHGSSGALAAGDLLVVFSKSGGSDEVNLTADRARTLGALVLVLTTRDSTDLTALADHTHVLPPAGPEDPDGVIAMGSTLVASAFGDAVAVALMRRRGYSVESVLFTHPGGAVGKNAAARDAGGDR